MAGTDSIVGQSGLIGEDLYLRKIERTCTFEDDDQIDDYQRDLLRDTAPDVPFFESDQPRRNYQSTQVINLRDGGRRDQTEPDLPDGEQLNFDPWVLDVPAGPDFQKSVAQQKARAKYINFYPDSDHSVPESGISPTQMVMQMKNAMPLTQNRWKIFETSMDNVQHGFLSQTKKCEVDKIKSDFEVPELNDCPNKYRIGATNEFSNVTQLGFRTNVDHQFKIARYGQVRAGNKLTDCYANREGAFVDHRISLPHEGLNISPDLAFMMVDLSKKKVRDHQIGKDNLIFPRALATQNVHKKITHDDMAGLQARQTVQTATLSANVEYEGKMLMMQGLTPAENLSRFGKVIVDPKIIDIISEIANRKMAPREMKDLREQIEQTSINSGVFVMDQAAATRKSGPQVYEALVSREAEKTELEPKESKQIFNYASLPLSDSNSGNTMGMQLSEAYKSTSKVRRPAAGSTNLQLPHLMNVTTNNMDVQPLEGLVKEKFARPMGSKYNFANMDRENPSDARDYENRNASRL